MLKIKRKEFLNEFLSALGAERIEWHKESENLLSGRVLYDINDSEEFQDFCWHLKEDNLPSLLVFNLAKMLNEEELVSIDQITKSCQELCNLYNDKYNSNISQKEFAEILEELEEIEVNMLDDGEETDIYFIHE